MNLSKYWICAILTNDMLVVGSTVPPSMDRLPVAKQIIRLRVICQDVPKASKDWYDHVGCYAMNKNNEKLKFYESLEFYEFREFHESLEIRESFKIY